MQKSKCLILIVVVGLILNVLIAQLTYQQVKQHLADKVSLDVDLLGQKLDAQLMRYSKLPELLANDPRLLQPLLADQTSPSKTNQYHQTSQLLQQWAATLSADTIYLINLQGETLAASNWQQPDSFVGQNYAYRPYFREAITGTPGQYFALGASSDKRGYYFSAPVYHQQSVIGVMTIKVDLSLIEDIWQYEDIEYVIADSQGVVFYSSENNWLYRSLIPLDEAQRQRILASRQYGNARLDPLTGYAGLDKLRHNEAINIRQPADEKSAAYVVANHDMAQAGWAIFGFSPISAAYQYVAQAVLMFSVFYFLLSLAVTSWWQTLKAQKALARLNDKLEQLVVKRTNTLLESNQQLKDTLRQYERSQAELKQTQSELVQAAKLAMLGELSASINHEINQPLAAMRTYAENSRKLLNKERYDSVANNIDEIIKLNQMVADIIARFKVFARKGSEHNNRTVAADSIRSATSLLRNKLIKEGVILRVGDLPADILINADAVQVEQVIINLLHNAIQALSSAHQPQIGIQLAALDTLVEIRIWDNGPGLDDDQKKRIFTPFFTTKSDGLGLGLTISRRIIDAFSGTLTVTDHPGGGAEFVITLPRSTEDTQ
ncbi:two-component sensor histidine kinase [Photobacterium proteolyticum]|uniref:C4-dicarboxylate transport sensor protein DctB n=1 Tax=Photobacterium proteolyticum TaxID=1903952 RepID=A0A1Q9GFH4_9GAMM|nr:ATP-binding protein [Photobacterium proteolyticum]OLQ73198.1 two-component sensor histidine kinase [Photobacterium proteolyticum]